MASNKSKAKSAMDISEKYKEITRLRQTVEVKLRELEEMVKAEGHPDFESSDVLKLRLAHAEALRSEISNGEAQWHNVAFSRGYFDTVAAPKKLSKFEQ